MNFLRGFRCIGLLLLIVFPFKINAQLSIGGIPKGKYGISAMSTEIIEMPSIDTVELLNKEKNNHSKAFVFGYNFNTNITTTNHGSWHNKGSDEQYWDTKIRSNGAYSISILLTNFKLKAGEKLFIYTRQEVMGAFTSANNHPSEILAIAPIRGDNVTVEFSTPYNEGKQGSFKIAKVTHAYKNIYDLPGSCNININCSEGTDWQIVKRAVCKLIIDGGTLCTGTLVNNTQNNTVPYMLTANHCINTDDEAANTVIFFDYESTSCYGNSGNDSHTLSGSYLRSTLYEGDFSLLELYNIPLPSFKPYYAGWTKEVSSNMNEVVSIHHPWGGVKKISVSKKHPTTTTYFDANEPPRTTNNFWLIGKWDSGVTEPGSSGGALFDMQGKIIGSLTGGEADCSNPVKDYFSKFANNIDAVAFNTEKMSYWLNSDNLNISFLNGFDPYGSINYTCDTFSHIYANEIDTVLPYQYGSGYNTGHNSDSITQYAEKFYTTDTIELSGALFNVYQKGMYGGIVLNVYTGNEIPETKVFESYISYNNMQPDSKNYFGFNQYPALKVHGNYFISYEIFYQPGDTFTVRQTFLHDTNKTNTAYLLADNTWQKFNKYMGYVGGTSLGIEPVSCKKYTSEKDEENRYLAYPNPVIYNQYGSYIYSQLPLNAHNIEKVEVCDLMGRTIKTNCILTGDVVSTDVSALHNGIYILRIFTTNKIYSAKFMVAN